MKKIVIVSFICLFAFTQLSGVKAIDFADQTNIKVDTTLVNEDTNFTLPTEIIITPVQTKNDDVNLTAEEHFRGLYYYTIQKLGYNDIPYHYLVAEDGAVFKGNSGEDEREIAISNGSNSAIIIGYLTDSRSTDFSIQGENALEELLISVANKNSIREDSVSVKKISFEKDIETRAVSIKESTITGSWNSSLVALKESIQKEYSPQAKQYGVDIASITAPTESIKPGEVTTITINLNNLNPTGLYGGTDTELILSKSDSSLSSFFLNGVWLSQTEVSLMTEDEILLPLQSASFDFEVQAPLAFGEISETFEIKTITGTKISTKEVTLTLNVERSDRDIIEILSTETGTLNVRREPSTLGVAFTQVSPGQRFFVLESNSNGYLKIDLGNGEEGWIAGWYATDI